MDTLNQIAQTSFSTPIVKDKAQNAAVTIKQWRIQEHENFIQCYKNGHDIAAKIQETDKNRILSHLLDIYAIDYLSLDAKLKIGLEIDAYNHAQAYKKMSFMDWFAVRDYIKGNLTEINLLSHKYNERASYPPPITQLLLALMRLTLQQETDEERTISYWSSISKQSIMQNLNKGDIQENELLIPGKNNMKSALSYCSSVNLLKDNNIDIYYKAYQDHNLVGAKIDQFLGKGLCHFIFLPDVKFVINEIMFNRSKTKVYIAMSTLDVNRAEFDSQLNNLVVNGRLIRKNDQ